MLKKTGLLFLLLFVLSSSFAQRKDKKSVRKAFDNYREAILNDRGSEAINYVDSRTISYYGEIAEKSRTADSLSLDASSLLDKVIIFTIRIKASHNEILDFTGESLLIYAIREGMVGKNSVVNNSIGDVEVEGDFANGEFLSNGDQTSMYFHFYKENEQWKIDLTSIFPIAEFAFQQMINDSGQDENEYLFLLLEMATGINLTNEIWHPIK